MPERQVSLPVAIRVDAACDRYEAAWRAGERPRIESYLTEAPAGDREPLLRALLLVELELRARSGQPVEVRDLLARFPDQASVIAGAQGSPPGTGATVSPSQGVVEPLERIGRFEIQAVLGEGAFGRVYQAVDPQLGREVALKVPLNDERITPADCDRFLREARAAAGVHHPNICQVHEVGEENGRPYIVMALVRGHSLAAMIKARKAPMPEKQAALIVRKLALALEAAHRRGVVHRDLKPANVMFDRERKDLVVMDFGLARLPQVGDASATQSGVIMGTPAYMSPEQARGAAKAAGPAADIYSLGVIFYELLAGRRPFVGGTAEVLGKILHVAPEPPSRYRPDLSPALEAVCLKAMAKEPGDRYRTMKDLADALGEAVKALAGSSAETARAVETATGTVRSDGADGPRLSELFEVLSADREEERAARREAAREGRRTARRLMVLIGLLIVGVLTALGGILFFARTKTVTVLISVDVDLKDRALSFFLDGKAITAEKLARPVELSVGEHELVVKRGQKVVKRILFTVRGGRNPGIDVREVEEPAVPRPRPPEGQPKEGKKDKTPEQAPPSVDPDRRAAEWVLSQGGSLRVVAEGDTETRLVKVKDDLPARFQVRRIDTWGRRLDDGSLKALTGLKHVRSVGLHGSHSVTAAGMKALSQFRDLEDLDVGGSAGVTDEGLAALAGLVKLRHLGLSLTGVTDAGAKHLAQLPNLIEVNLSGTKITDAGVATLSRMGNLVQLGLGNTAVTDVGAGHLARLRKLTRLGLGHTQVTSAGLAKLKDLPLRDLTLANCALGAGGLSPLKEHVQLAILHLHGTDVKDGDMAPLAALPNLRWLALRDTKIGDAGVVLLAKAPSLKELNLEKSRVTDESVATLARMKTLVYLNVDGTRMTAEGRQRLRKALPGCQVVPAN